MLKKIFIRLGIVFLICLITKVSIAQKQTDISLMPAFENIDAEMNRTAMDVLLNKVKNEITRQGYSGVNTSRFVLLINPQVTDKQHNGQLMLYAYDLQFSVIDIIADKAYSSFSITMGGTGKSGGQAMANAVNRIDFSKSKLSQNLSLAVSDIIKYYNANCASIIAKTKLYLAAGQYEAAMGHLAFIPDLENLSCKTEYNATLLKTLQQYTAYKCHAQLTEAKQAWSLNPTISGAESVAYALSGINLSPACKKEFDDLMNSIKNKLQKDQFDNKEFAKKILESTVAIERDRVSASRDIAVSYYQSLMPQSYIYLR